MTVLENIERLALLRSVSKIKLRPDLYRRLIAEHDERPRRTFSAMGVAHQRQPRWVEIGGVVIEPRRKSAEACGCDEGAEYVCRQCRGE